MEFQNKKRTFFWGGGVRIAKKFDTLKFGVLSLTYQIYGKFGCRTKKVFFFFKFNFCLNRRFFLDLVQNGQKQRYLGILNHFLKGISQISIIWIKNEFHNTLMTQQETFFFKSLFLNIKPYVHQGYACKAGSRNYY